MRTLILALASLILPNLFFLGPSTSSALARASEELIEGVTLYLSTDYEQATAVLIPLAQAGDSDARYLMTLDPTATRPTAAFEAWAALQGDPQLVDGIVRGWIGQAARDDHFGAIELLFRAQIDMDTRIRWGERGAELGMPDAEEWLATVRLGFYGEEFTQAGRGVELLERAVEKDDIHALIFYGYHLTRGEIVERDFARGLDLLRRAAEKGDTDAVAVLAQIHDADPDEAPPPTEALTWLYIDFDRSGREAGAEAIAKVEWKLSPNEQRQARRAADMWWAEHLSNRETDLGRAAAWLARTYPQRHWEPWEIAFISKTVECPVPRLKKIIVADYGESADYARCMERGLEDFKMPR
jgi:hypothetical protein